MLLAFLAYLPRLTSWALLPMRRITKTLLCLPWDFLKNFGDFSYKNFQLSSGFHFLSIPGNWKISCSPTPPPNYVCLIPFVHSVPSLAPTHITQKLSHSAPAAGSLPPAPLAWWGQKLHLSTPPLTPTPVPGTGQIVGILSFNRILLNFYIEFVMQSLWHYMHNAFLEILVNQHMYLHGLMS